MDETQGVLFLGTGRVSQDFKRHQLRRRQEQVWCVTMDKYTNEQISGNRAVGPPKGDGKKINFMCPIKFLFLNLSWQSRWHMIGVWSNILSFANGQKDFPRLRGLPSRG